MASSKGHELYDVRPEQRIGKLASRHRVRSKDRVRPGTMKLFAGFFFRDTGDNGELRIESFRGENDEEVFRVGRQRGNETLRPEDARFPKVVIAGSVGGDGQHSCCSGLCDALLIPIDDEKGGVWPLHFIGGVTADAAEAADDEVVVQTIDHAFLPAFAVEIL